jgi:hypothetical protein
MARPRVLLCAISARHIADGMPPPVPVAPQAELALNGTANPSVNSTKSQVSCSIAQTIEHIANGIGNAFDEFDPFMI